MKLKIPLLLLISIFLGFMANMIGLTPKQSVIVSVFTMSILGTLFFWDFKLSFVFVGSGVLMLMGAVGMEEFVKFASLDVILFLISMMIIVGMMKDAGFFMWLLTLLLRVKKLTGLKMFVILMVASAVFSGLMGEVASILVVVTIIFNICDFLEVDPLPLVISSVMATNIGSAATVLGNPVGVLIAARGKLSFEDFITHAMPISIIVLFITIIILYIYNRNYIKKLDQAIQPFAEDRQFLYLISVPPDIRTKISILIFMITIVLIGFHHRFEDLLDLEQNTLLIMIPIISAGIVMLYRYDRARHYIEHEIEWPSLLFFMFLFAQAGIIQASGIAQFFAQKIFALANNSSEILSMIVLFSSGILSSGIDNVVTVASMVPVIQSMDSFGFSLNPLWWALLFGACFGGNITMIGSTANIVALGLLEKERNIKMTFVRWLKVGFLVGMVSMFIAAGFLLLLPELWS